MAQWFLENVKTPGLRFRIVKLDKVNMRAVLQGDTGVPFERDISQPTLDKFGYKIVKVEDH